MRLLFSIFFFAVSAFQVYGASEISNNYLFLVFPRVDCAQIKSEGIKCSDRPVIASRKEINSGVVRYIDEFQRESAVSVNDLGYLPFNGKKFSAEEMDVALKNMGYSAGHWKYTSVDGVFKITLILKDGRHARTEYYSYQVKNNSLISAEEVRVVGIFEEVIFGMTIFGSLFILVLICFWFRRKIQSASKALEN